jgi:hypothetical protein
MLSFSWSGYGRRGANQSFVTPPTLALTAEAKRRIRTP